MHNMHFSAEKWLLFVLMGLSSSLANGQQTGNLLQPISLDVKDQPVGNVLTLIDQQTSLLSFSFNPDKIPVRALVTYRAINQPLADILEYLATEFHFEFALLEKQIVLTPVKSSSPLSFNLSGFVVDKNSGDYFLPNIYPYIYYINEESTSAPSPS